MVQNAKPQIEVTHVFLLVLGSQSILHLLLDLHVQSRNCGQLCVCAINMECQPLCRLVYGTDLSLFTVKFRKCTVGILLLQESQVLALHGWNQVSG